MWKYSGKNKKIPKKSKIYSIQIYSLGRGKLKKKIENNNTLPLLQI